MAACDDKRVLEFADAAHSFCSLIDECEKLSHAQFTRFVAARLATLYAATFEFMRVCDDRRDASGDDDADDSPHAGDYMERYDPLKHRIQKVLNASLYARVYNPLYPEADKAGSPESSVGDVSDDLADIYLDLAPWVPKLRSRDESMVEDAIRHIQFGFESHWGYHAAAALDVLFFVWIENCLGEE